MKIKIIGEVEKKDDGMCDYCHENRRVFYPNDKGNLSRRLGMCSVCKSKMERQQLLRQRERTKQTNRVNFQLNLRNKSRYEKW